MVAAPAVRAQDRAPREPERRVVIDGLGGTIGATVRDVTAEEAKRAKLSQSEGAYVTRVDSEGPAAKAGIAAGDIIVEFDGERVRSSRQLSRLVRESADGRTVRSAVVRDGNRRTVELTPQFERPWFRMPDLSGLERDMRELRGRFEFDFGGRRARLGVSLTPVSDQLAAYFGVQRGVLVQSVDADSPASRAGLRAGDVITSVNGRSVSSVSDVLEEVRRAGDGASIPVTVMRDKKEVTLTARMPESTRPAPRSGGRSI
jgi:serine protease Do